MIDAGLAGLLLPVAAFSFTMSATPGPNNIMLTASGANFGFRRTIPHMLGVSTGFLTLICVVAMGLGAVFTGYPAMQTALKVVGSLYLIYLGVRIARTRPRRIDADDVPVGRPLRFIEAAAFQYANPKAWVMAISAVSTFTLSGDAYAASAALVAVTCSLVNLPSITLWAGFGTAIGRLLSSERSWRLFNLCMGAMTIACVGLIVAR